MSCNRGIKWINIFLFWHPIRYSLRDGKKKNCLWKYFLETDLVSYFRITCFNVNVYVLFVTKKSTRTMNHITVTDLRSESWNNRVRYCPVHPGDRLPFKTEFLVFYFPWHSWQSVGIIQSVENGAARDMRSRNARRITILLFVTNYSVSLSPLSTRSCVRWKKKTARRRTDRARVVRQCSPRAAPNTVCHALRRRRFASEISYERPRSVLA